MRLGQRFESARRLFFIGLDEPNTRDIELEAGSEGAEIVVFGAPNTESATPRWCPTGGRTLTPPLVARPEAAGFPRGQVDGVALCATAVCEVVLGGRGGA
jgi:hypothetical protein